MHIVSLKSVGGVQTSFLSFFKISKRRSEYKHLIMSQHKVHPFFKELNQDHINFKSSFYNILKLIYFILSKNHIVHFHNNIGSKGIDWLLRILPSKNLIFHEYGTAWNAKKSKQSIYKRNEKRSYRIIACSEAARTVLVQHLGLDKHKIDVVHHTGLIDKYPKKNVKSFSNKFAVGFIGRLDTPKGVHVFINAAKNLSDYDFFIAGEGVLEGKMKILAKGIKNIHFLGVQEPIDFMSKIDLLVVPSIREPLGNILIEAGHAKLAVIAANVDGIPEVIDHGVNGILITPTEKLNIGRLPQNAVPIPKIVVDPENQKIISPKEINVGTLCQNIKNLAEDKQRLILIGEELNKKIINNFSLNIYFEKVEKIYKSLKKTN